MREFAPHLTNVSFESFSSSMREEFQRAVVEFTTPKQLSLLIGSWNVNAKVEDAKNMSTWLRRSDVEVADMVVVGLQEVIELSPTNTVIGSSFSGSSESSSVSSVASERWSSQVLLYLNEETPSNNKFFLVESSTMVGTAQFIFLRAEHKDRVRNIQARSIFRGGGGFLGNKGAVCIRMDINSTSVCFVNAHLCAHREDVYKRNEDFRVIYHTPVFQTPGFDVMRALKYDALRNAKNSANSAHITRLRAKMKTKEGSTSARVGMDDTYLRAVKEHDIVFFFGDLNYRIAEGFEIEEVYDVIELSNGNVMSDINNVLLEQDQLHIEMKENRAFQNFNESPIAFKPTYQYLAGTDEYDRRPDRKLRCPGWCDRILWKTNNPLYYKSSAKWKNNDATYPGNVKPVLYERCENRISDHKPICAMFDVSTVIIKPELREQLLSNAVSAWFKHSQANTALAVSVNPEFISIRSNQEQANSFFEIRLTNSSEAIAFEILLEVPSWVKSCAGVTVSLAPSSEVTCEFEVDRNASSNIIVKQGPNILNPPCMSTPTVGAIATDNVDFAALGGYIRFKIQNGHSSTCVIDVPTQYIVYL